MLSRVLDGPQPDRSCCGPRAEDSSRAKTLPWSPVRSQTGSTTNPWQFTGQQLDAESSLYFLRARYYDPSTGRFLGKDPFPGSAARPLSLNRYAYVQDNPPNGADPSGMVATTGDANISDQRIVDFGGNSGNYEGGSFKRVDCSGADPSFDAYLFCPDATARLAGGIGSVRIPYAIRALLDWIRGEVGGGEEAAGESVGPAGQSSITVDEILRNPEVLAGKSKWEVEEALGELPPGWRVEQLGQGSHEGQGWVLRQYTAEGNPTGRMIRWHPGGGHHGPGAYWRVTSSEFGKSGWIPSSGLE